MGNHENVSSHKKGPLLCCFAGLPSQQQREPVGFLGMACYFSGADAKAAVIVARSIGRALQHVPLLDMELEFCRLEGNKGATEMYSTIICISIPNEERRGCLTKQGYGKGFPSV